MVLNQDYINLCLITCKKKGEPMEGNLKQLTQRLLTLDEASTLLKINKGTLQNWLSQKRIKRVKMGGKTFVDSESIENLLVKALS